MLSWAVRRAIITRNNVLGFQRIHHADRSERIWLPEHIEAFRSTVPAGLEHALLLALHTGQRQGDLLRLPWSAYDGTALTLRQSKTGRRVVIPCTAAVRSLLDSLPRHGVQILTTARGRPWTPWAFRRAWKQAADEAGLGPQQLHFP
jgi:integrase